MQKLFLSSILFGFSVFHSMAAGTEDICAAKKAGDYSLLKTGAEIFLFREEHGSRAIIPMGQIGESQQSDGSTFITGRDPFLVGGRVESSHLNSGFALKESSDGVTLVEGRTYILVQKAFHCRDSEGNRLNELDFSKDFECKGKSKDFEGNEVEFQIHSKSGLVHWNDPVLKAEFKVDSADIKSLQASSESNGTMLGLRLNESYIFVNGESHAFQACSPDPKEKFSPVLLGEPSGDESQ